MGRGLGWLQREVLATLDEAKGTPLRYAGSRATALDGAPGRVAVHGYVTNLPDGVYDLRASLQFLARQHGKAHTDTLGRSSGVSDKFIEATFRISFYRAVRSLIRRGILHWCNHRGQTSLSGPYPGREGRLVCRGDTG
jgi:hypothetical protein